MLSSQIQVHEKYGGIVPELASRKHLTTLPWVLNACMKEAGIGFEALDAVAVTTSPGLVGSLLVGVSYAKALAWCHGLDLFGVDHLEGHLLAAFLDDSSLDFPFLGLIASGGHTHLILAEGFGCYRLLGRTMDDAAGEAFDKVAKVLGFVYPGGPIIDRLAQLDGAKTDFPLPLKSKKTLNFSYSGLKTAVKNEAKAQGLWREKEKLVSVEEFLASSNQEQVEKVASIAKGFQHIMTQSMIQRLQQASKLTGVKRLVLSGGVASNSHLREHLKLLAKKIGGSFHAPSPIHCTDNAAMIAYVAWRRQRSGEKPGLDLALNPSSKSPIGQMDVDLMGIAL